MADLESARRDLDSRLKHLKERLSDSGFLANKGLGNEVGIYTFCYDPSLELEVRDIVQRLKQDSSLGCNIIEYNLYDIALDRLEKRGLLEKMPTQELKRGKEWVIRQMGKICDAAMYAQEIASVPHEPGDVVLITGIGEVYPFMRLHNLLENIQPYVKETPIIAVYPGRFDGKTLQLFSRLEDEHYYRAFDLV